jgi:hypothetical protein
LTYSDIFEAVQAALLSSSINPNQVESYEGQFEDPDEFIIIPPAVFIDVARGGKSNATANGKAIDFVLYLCSDSLKANPQTSNMLDMIQAVEETLKQIILPGQIISYTGFEKIGNFPGFKIYQLSFSVN